MSTFTALDPANDKKENSPARKRGAVHQPDIHPGISDRLLASASEIIEAIIARMSANPHTRKLKKRAQPGSAPK